MSNATLSGRPGSQRASRLSRDLIIDLAAARAALRKAQALARKLKKAGAGETTAQLAGELTTHIVSASKALSRAGRPKPGLRSPARRQRSGI